MMILADIIAAEWVLGIVGTVLGGIVLTSVIAVAAHISNADRHPSKKDIVFADVCTAKEKGVEIEIKNVKDAMNKLENTVSNGFQAITAQIQQLNK
jgi:hypothetical protein